MTDRTVYTRLRGDVSDFQRSMMAASASARSFSDELNTSNDRTTMLTQSILALAPAFVPVAAAAVPALAGLTNQLGFAVAGAGVAVLAFSGVGDALKATNAYAIEPTDANLKKMRQSLSELGPAGREFVSFLQEIRPQLQGLQDAAQEGLFPGAEAGIKDLMTLLPQAERIVGEIAGAMGDLIAEGGENLASPRWADFFDFLETEARPTLMDFGRTMGNLAEGFANMWMAFEPVSSDFSDSFLNMSRDFAAWSDGMSDTASFQEFLDYISRTGPKVGETLGAVGNALLQIVEAAAPVGEAALPAIEAMANGIAKVADSDIGPVVIGIVALTSAYSRLIAVSGAASVGAMGGLFKRSAYSGLVAGARDLRGATRAHFDYGAALDRSNAAAGRFASTSQRLSVAMRGGAGIAAGVGGLAFVMSDLDNKMGLSNTAMLGMAGSMMGPWGAAVGAGVGFAMDFAAANDGVEKAVSRANAALADGPKSLELQRTALDAAQKEFRKYTDDVEGLNPFKGILNNMPGIKDGLSGLFGDSDVEEAAASLKAAEEQYAKNSAAAQQLRFDEAGLADAMSGTSQAAQDQVDLMLQLLDARNELANQALSAADKELAYEQSISSANDRIAKRTELETELAKAQDPAARERIQEQLDTYAATLDKTTEAGQANRKALYDMAGAWNNLDPATQSAKGAAQRARTEFVKVAMQMGATRERAEQLASKYMEIPTKVSTKVDLKGVEEAKTAANAIGDALARLVDKTIHIKTVRTGDDAGKGARAPGGFTGMRVPAGYADGGRVPGTPPTDPTEDNVFAVTANGNPLMLRSREWIINEPQSDKNDRWLRAINNGLNLDEFFGPIAIPGFAAGGRYDDFSKLEHSSRLDLAHQQQRIRQIEQSLKDKETVGKGKSKHKRLALRGLDREVAELELRDAKAELARMKRDNKKLKKYGTKAQEEAVRDREEDAERSAKEAADDAVKAAEDIVKEAADRFTNAKTTAAATFEIGSATSAAAVDRNLARLLSNSQTYLGLLGDLKSKGASPWLLGELVKAGPTGGAIRLAREYNNDQGKLNAINSRASQIDQYTNAYAGLVGNAAFTAPAAWNSGVSSASQAPMVASIVGAEVAVGSDGLMKFVKGQIVVAQDQMQIEVGVS
jgi:hypothetical protein